MFHVTFRPSFWRVNEVSETVSGSYRETRIHYFAFVN